MESGYIARAVATISDDEPHQELHKILDDYLNAKHIIGHDETVNTILNNAMESGLRIRVLMVGDGTPDLQVAHNAVQVLKDTIGFTATHLCIESVAVSYGFQSADDLRKANPTYLVRDPRELPSVTGLWAMLGTPNMGEPRLRSFLCSQQPKATKAAATATP